MDAKDSLSLIITIGDDVWKNYGYFVTLNIAILGWLIQRHGLYNIREKILATLGYSGFIAVLLMGMDTAYEKLDLAANELAYKYIIPAKTPVKEGIIENYIKKSPKYCDKVYPDNISSCGEYYDNFYFSAWVISLGWIFNIFLFWYQGLWLAIRDNQRET